MSYTSGVDIKEAGFSEHFSNFVDISSDVSEHTTNITDTHSSIQDHIGDMTDVHSTIQEHATDVVSDHIKDVATSEPSTIREVINFIIDLFS